MTLERRAPTDVVTLNLSCVTFKTDEITKDVIVQSSPQPQLMEMVFTFTGVTFPNPIK